MTRFRNGVISSAHPLATRIGISILKKGGNAVDAAVAVSLMLGVVQPALSGIGGGGFALMHLASGEMRAIDYRETAPLASSSEMFEVLPDGEVRGNLNRIGPLAIATPGTIAGLIYLLETYGTMKFRDISEKAIAQARSGFPLDRIVVTMLRENGGFAFEKLRKYAAGSAVFLRNGKVPHLGQTIKLPELGGTLQQISMYGRASFYTGRVAKLAVQYIRNIGGIISPEDFAHYTVKERKPIEGSYRGFTIVTMPPPSAGGASLLQSLNILENYDYDKSRSDWYHLIAESFKLALKDKRAAFGDPDFIEVPLQTLIGKEYAKKQIARIREGQTLNFREMLNHEQHGSTTHFSIADDKGNVVAVSESIECYFGSGVVVPGMGLLFNDQMHDFDPVPGRANSIEPRKRPVSSMTPTIIFRDGTPLFALGGAGGERIISSVIQVVSYLIDRKMSIVGALAHPRIHQAGEDLLVEKGIKGQAVKKLRTKGHHVAFRPSLDLYFGGIHAIQIDGRHGTYSGGADPRFPGEALGY